jgi:predicted RNA-binding Zn-ribbon protein involved in translation (DUF1610 family)
MPLSLIKDRIFKIGNYALVGAVFGVVFDHWGLLPLNKIPIPYLSPFLHLYLLINASAASVFIYLEKKNKVAIDRFCPECGGKLEIHNRFKCPACGEIKIGKNP